MTNALIDRLSIRPLAPGPERAFAAALDAARAGIRRFVNESGPDDAALRRIFRQAGYETVTVYEAGVLRSSFAIP